MGRTESIARAEQDDDLKDTPASRTRITRARVALLALGATVTTGITAQLRLGYQFGFRDQGVLSIRGISSADPSAFQNDWFNQYASQPHWTFDVVTYAGESIGALPIVYLLYFVAALISFGLAIAILAERWLPTRIRWLSLLIGPIVVLGPISPLGSTTPILPVAIPHVLGGTLACLTLALLVSKRYKLVVLATILTALAHVQHGANVAVILLAYAAFTTTSSRRDRLMVAAAGVIAAVYSVVATRVRGITGNGADFIEICELRSPHHCNADVWAPFKLSSGWILLVMIIIVIIIVPRGERRALAIIAGLPTIGLLLGVWADRFNAPIAGELAQVTNIYRLVTLILPLAAWAPLLLMVRASGREERSLSLVFGVTLLAIWFGSYTAVSDITDGNGNAHLLALAFGITIALAAWSTRVAPQYAAALFVAMAVAFVVHWDALDLRRPRMGLNASDPRVVTGRQIEEAIPVGSIIASPPSINWLRYASRRAIVLDCKAVPYGGRSWEEFKDRMEHLGGWQCNSTGTRTSLTLGDVADLHDRYGATHFLTGEDDPKFHDAKVAGWELVGEYSSWIADPAFPSVVPSSMMKLRLFEIP